MYTSGKDRLLSFTETFLNSIKFHNIFFGLRFVYHAVIVRFYIKNKKGNYKIFGKKFYFLNYESLLNCVIELFGDNLYYFKTTINNPVIIDLGANVGDSIIYFKWLYPESTIYAFEPNPGAFEILKKNVEVNHFQKIFLNNRAVGRENSVIKFYDDSSGAFNITTINREFLVAALKALGKTGNKISEVNVPFEKMSENLEIQKLKRIDLLKMDIEGSELAVLEDIQTIFPKIDRIILEYHLVEGMKDNSFDQIYNLLSRNNFKIQISGMGRNSQNFGNSITLMINANNTRAH